MQQPNLLRDRFNSLDVKRAGFAFQLVLRQRCQNEVACFCRRFYRSLTISRTRTITFKLNLRSAMNAMSSVKKPNKNTAFIPILGAKRQCQGLFNSRCNLSHLSPKIHIPKFSRIISIHFLRELVGKFDKRTKHFHFMIILFVIPITFPFNCILMLLGEHSCWSLLRLRDRFHGDLSVHKNVWLSGVGKYELSEIIRRLFSLAEAQRCLNVR